MLLDEEIPELESIDSGGILTFEKRLEALEASLSALTRTLETQLFSQVRRIEESVIQQADQTRMELNLESTSRLEQFSKLALKLSRHLDELKQGDSVKKAS